MVFSSVKRYVFLLSFLFAQALSFFAIPCSAMESSGEDEKSAFGRTTECRCSDDKHPSSPTVPPRPSKKRALPYHLENRLPLDSMCSLLQTGCGGGRPPYPEKECLINHLRSLAVPVAVALPPFHLLDNTRRALLLSMRPEEVRDRDTCLPTSPDEMLVLIFSFLDRKGLTAASRTCQRFYRNAHDREVVIGSFETTARNFYQSGCRTQELGEHFNALWPTDSDAEQRAAQLQAFETGFEAEINRIWTEVKFYAQMLKKPPLRLSHTRFSGILVRAPISNFLIGIQDDTLLGKLALTQHRLNSLCSGNERIDARFRACGTTFFPTLDEKKLEECRFGKWKRLAPRRIQRVQVQRVQVQRVQIQWPVPNLFVPQDGDEEGSYDDQGEGEGSYDDQGEGE